VDCLAFYHEILVMRTFTRDDTEHGVEYVTLAEAMAEVHCWREKCQEVSKLRAAIRDYRDAKGRHHTKLACDRLLQLISE